MSARPGPRAPLTPERFAALHPRLYHYAQEGASEGVRRHGLLTAARAVALWGADPGLLAAPRPRPVALRHPERAALWLNDNRPLGLAALAGCLDDGLDPGDWLAMLAERVFFWTREADGAGFVQARRRQGLPAELLVFDTAGLAAAHWPRLEIAPINTGSTRRRPARRGRETFAPVMGLDWAAWRRARGRSTPDRVREVVVRGSVEDAARHLIEVRPVA